MNDWADFDQIWSEASLGEGEQIIYYILYINGGSGPPGGWGAGPNRGNIANSLKSFFFCRNERICSIFGLKHPWVKGNEFCINRGSGPPVAWGAGPNRGNIANFSLKSFFFCRNERICSIFGQKHPWWKGNTFCLNGGSGPPGGWGAGPNTGYIANSLKSFFFCRNERICSIFGLKHPWVKGNEFCINRGSSPPGAWGAGPNRGNIANYSLKSFFFCRNERIWSIFGVEHPWVKGKHFV